jgi:hypothetical protein
MWLDGRICSGPNVHAKTRPPRHVPVIAFVKTLMLPRNSLALLRTASICERRASATRLRIGREFSELAKRQELRIGRSAQIELGQIAQTIEKHSEEYCSAIRLRIALGRGRC